MTSPSIHDTYRISTIASQPITEALNKRLLPEPDKLKASIDTPSSRTNLSRVIRTSAVVLGTLAGVGLGALTGLLAAGTLVTPVGWAILGGIAAFALIVGIAEGGVQGGALVLGGILSGWMIGFGVTLLSKVESMSMIQYQTDQGSIVNRVDKAKASMLGFGGLGSVIGGLYGAGGSIMGAVGGEHRDNKLLNLACPTYGVPKKKEEFQRLLQQCFDQKNKKNLIVDSKGQLKFVKSSMSERMWSQLRTYTGSNQKIVELQMIKLLSQGIKKGWIEKPFTPEQKDEIRKRIGMANGDGALNDLLGKAGTLKVGTMSPRQADGLDNIYNGFYASQAKAIVESQGDKATVGAFYYDEGMKALRKGNDYEAAFYFSQGRNYSKNCEKVYIKTMNDFYYKRGQAALENGNNQDAVFYFKQGAKYSIECLLALAECDFEEAGKYLLIAAEYHYMKKDTEGLEKIATICTSRGKQAELSTILRQLYDLYLEDKNEKQLATIADRYLQIKDYRSVVECIADYIDVKYGTKKGPFHSKNKITQAINYLERQADRIKHEYRPWLALAIVYKHGIQTPKNLERAKGYYSNAAERNPALGDH